MFRKSSHANVDGFIVRNRGSQPAPPRLGIDNLELPGRFLKKPPSHSQDKMVADRLRPAVPGHGLSPQQSASSAAGGLSQVLAEMPLEVEEPGKRPKPERALRRHRLRRFLKFGALSLLVGLLLIGGYVGVKFFLAGGRVFNGNLFAALISEGKNLKTDQYGRVNVLLFGTSEDDPQHDGALLTDSIMLLNINPKDKTGFMLSVPRDLWVKYGQACTSGYEGKINAAYECGLGQSKNESAGAAMLIKMVEQFTGTNVQYYVHVNYTALRDAVNAVGGVTVTINSSDPRGILDRNFDWKCNFRCYYVKYPNGPVTLDGEHALALARARNAAGGYGLSGGNFDREKYQREIIVALRNKAMSAGVLTNPVKVTKLIDGLGNNVKTNFSASEVKTLIRLAQQVDASKLATINLVDPNAPLVTTGAYGDQSIVRPVAGLMNFSKIQAVVRAYETGEIAVVNEAAKIDVLNGSGVPGAAQKQADALAAQGLTIGVVGNAAGGPYAAKYQLYDLKGDKPATRAKLENLLGVTSQDKASLPSTISSRADFVIIVGGNGVN